MTSGQLCSEMGPDVGHSSTESHDGGKTEPAPPSSCHCACASADEVAVLRQRVADLEFELAECRRQLEASDQAVREARDVERKITDVVNLMPVVLVETTLSGQVISVSNHWHRMMGFEDSWASSFVSSPLPRSSSCSPYVSLFVSHGQSQSARIGFYELHSRRR